MNGRGQHGRSVGHSPPLFHVRKLEPKRRHSSVRQLVGQRSHEWMIHPRTRAVRQCQDTFCVLRPQQNRLHLARVLNTKTNVFRDHDFDEGILTIVTLAFLTAGEANEYDPPTALPSGSRQRKKNQQATAGKVFADQSVESCRAISRWSPSPPHERKRLDA